MKLYPPHCGTAGFLLRQGPRDIGGHLPVKEQILIFLIAQRYKAETSITDEIAVPYSELYTRFSDEDDSTIRGTSWT